MAFFGTRKPGVLWAADRVSVVTTDGRICRRLWRLYLNRSISFTSLSRCACVPDNTSVVVAVVLLVLLLLLLMLLLFYATGSLHSSASFEWRVIDRSPVILHQDSLSRPLSNFAVFYCLLFSCLFCVALFTAEVSIDGTFFVAPRSLRLICLSRLEITFRIELSVKTETISF